MIGFHLIASPSGRSVRRIALVSCARRHRGSRGGCSTRRRVGELRVGLPRRYALGSRDLEQRRDRDDRHLESQCQQRVHTNGVQHVLGRHGQFRLHVLD